MPVPEILPGKPVKTSELSSLFLGLQDSLWDASRQLNDNCKGIVLVVDANRKLLGTLTDGDIRRWLLDEQSLDSRIADVLDHKEHSPYPEPVTATPETSNDQLLDLMREYAIHQVPIVDDLGRVVDLITMDDLVPNEELPVQAMIMAGGLGKRLRPLTANLPKPMLPVGDRPLMELIVRQLKQAGIHRINVSTCYQADRIVEHFGNGRAFGVAINYVPEDEPLGTAGALGLLPQSNDSLLVINGDILTNLGIRDLYAYHRQHGAVLTVGMRSYEVKIPYGVIECDGPSITKVTEKPSMEFMVNAGVYLVEPAALQYIPIGQQYDMTDLIQCLIADGHPVAGFPILDYWLDIGRHPDYEKAVDDIQAGRVAA